MEGSKSMMSIRSRKSKWEKEPKIFDPKDYYRPDETCKNIESQPNRYPEYLTEAKPMAFVGVESDCFQSIYEAVVIGFKCADRVLLMTPWGNYVIFRVLKSEEETKPDEDTTYFLYDGCTCNANSFRYLDLRTGTAGFLTFCSFKTIVYYILDSQFNRAKLTSIRKPVLDILCQDKGSSGEHEEELHEPAVSHTK